MKQINQRKYRKEYFNFRTPKGIQKKLIVVLSGERERERLLAKGEKLAKDNGWKFF